MANIVINNTVLTFNHVLYVSTLGSDSSGNGSADFPYASLYKAINAASSGDAICILRGKYRLTPFYLNQYTSAGIHDKGKNLFICGENEKTILEFYGADVTSSRDSNFICTYATTTITNLTLNFYPNKGNNYSNAIIVDSVALRLKNCFIENKGSQYWSYRYNNNADARTPVENCIFQSHGRSSNDYSGNPIYYNCLFDYTPTSGSRYNCVTRSITSNDFDLDTLPTDLLHKGSTSGSYLNPDGTVNNIGVMGGSYMWSTLYAYIPILLSDRHYGVYPIIDGVKVALDLVGQYNKSFKYKIVDDNNNTVIDYDEYFTTPCTLEFTIPNDNIILNSINEYVIYVLYETGLESNAGIFEIFPTKDKYIVFHKAIIFKTTKPIIQANSIMVSVKGSFKFISSAVSFDNINYTELPLNILFNTNSFKQVKLILFMSDEAELKSYGFACI